MFAVGEKVRVYISESEKTASITMLGFSGKASKIRSVEMYKGSFRTYTLENFKSAHGCYYEFPEEWLFPANEREEAV